MVPTRYLKLVIPVLCLLSVIISHANAEDQLDEFIPTSEWQEVRPGQSIPSGLHVRMDLQKGGRWAKLMDENSEKTSVAAISKKTEDGIRKVDNINNIDQLKSALKKIKDEKVEDGMTEQEKKDIKNKFRSMDEIKSAFDELQLQQETDFQVMHRLLKRYHNDSVSSKEKILILKDLEVYVHQVDNAVDFVKLGGIESMVTALNSSGTEIRIEAAHVLGSAVQSNPTVQVKAVEAGALTSLIHIISNANEVEDARKKALYAVSCLIRHFPSAQYMFRNGGGFAALASCLNEQGSEKLRFRALSLINDLTLERKDRSSSAGQSEHDVEKDRQYLLFSLSDEIEQLGFCKVIAKLLQTSEHDQREILVTVMENLHKMCSKNLDVITKVRKALQEYESEYKLLAREEELEGDFDGYFYSMHKKIVDLRKLLTDGQLRNDHVEL